MNLRSCRVALRPRGPLEVFDLAMRFSRERPNAFLRLAAVLLVPWLPLLAVACWLTEGHPALLILPLLVGPVLQGPFTVLLGRALFDDDMGTMRSLVWVARQLPTLAVSWALGFAGLAVASLTCFAALLPIQAALLFLPEMTLLERVDPGRALSRSVRLAGGGFGSTLAGALGKWVLLGWCALVGETAGHALVGFLFQLGQPFGSALTGFVTPYLLFGLLFGHVLHAVYRLFLYLDARTRLEGWDIQVGMLALGGQ